MQRERHKSDQFSFDVVAVVLRAVVLLVLLLLAEGELAIDAGIQRLVHKERIIDGRG